LGRWRDGHVSGDGGNGDDWRNPRLSLLRTAAVAVILGLLIWVFVVEDGPTDASTVGTLLGSLIVILGFAQWHRQ
jgi:hypothetical protein